MLVDVGVNLLNKQFQHDREEIISRATNAGVNGLLITASHLNEAREAITLCSEQGHYCTAGVHPHNAGDVGSDWLTELREMASHDHVRAVGEMGLDFNRNFSSRQDQVKVFCAQIELAKEVNKSLFVHDRDSEGEVLQQLRNAGPLPPTLVHCFTGSAQELDDYLAEGYYIGITGWVTDPRRGEDLRALIPKIPLNRMLLETDAPYLKPFNTPSSFLTEHDISNKYKRRNEPSLLPYVLDAIAALRMETSDEIMSATGANAALLFGF